MTTRFRATAWLLVTFLLGVLAGAGGARFYLENQAPASISRQSRSRPLIPPEELAQRYERDAGLNLTAGQRMELIEVLQSSRERFVALTEEGKAEFRQLRRETEGRIREILDPEQVQRYDAYLKAKAEAHARRRAESE